jgi:hypothetical protein
MQAEDFIVGQPLIFIAAWRNTMTPSINQQKQQRDFRGRGN